MSDYTARELEQAIDDVAREFVDAAEDASSRLSGLSAEIGDLVEDNGEYDPDGDEVASGGVALYDMEITMDTDIGSVTINVPVVSEGDSEPDEPSNGPITLAQVVGHQQPGKCACLTKCTAAIGAMAEHIANMIDLAYAKGTAQGRYLENNVKAE